MNESCGPKAEFQNQESIPAPGEMKSQRSSWKMRRVIKLWSQHIGKVISTDIETTKEKGRERSVEKYSKKTGI